jgi:hypothetical protein
VLFFVPLAAEVCSCHSIIAIVLMWMFYGVTKFEYVHSDVVYLPNFLFAIPNVADFVRCSCMIKKKASLLLKASFSCSPLCVCVCVCVCALLY